MHVRIFKSTEEMRYVHSLSASYLIFSAVLGRIIPRIVTGVCVIPDTSLRILLFWPTEQRSWSSIPLGMCRCFDAHLFVHLAFHWSKPNQRKSIGKKCCVCTIQRISEPMTELTMSFMFRTLIVLVALAKLATSVGQRVHHINVVPTEIIQYFVFVPFRCLGNKMLQY